MLNTRSISWDIESSHLCNGTGPTSIFIFASTHGEHPIPLLLSEERTLTDSIYSALRSCLLQRTLVSFEAAPRRSMLREEIPTLLHMAKNIHGPRVGCTSLVPRVMPHDPSPPKKWIPCHLRPCITYGGPYRLCPMRQLYAGSCSLRWFFPTPRGLQSRLEVVSCRAHLSPSHRAPQW